MRLGGRSTIQRLRLLSIPYFLRPAFSIFLLRQLFRRIPNDLLDAARLDGASALRIYRNVVLSLSRPARAMIGLFAFVGAWTNFLNPLLYLNDPKMCTLSISLYNFFLRARRRMGTTGNSVSDDERSVGQDFYFRATPALRIHLPDGIEITKHYRVSRSCGEKHENFFGGTARDSSRSARRQHIAR